MYSKNLFSLKNIIIYLLVAALLYGAAYYLFLGKKGPYTVTDNQQQSLNSEMQPTIQLNAQNNSNEKGTAKVSDDSGKTVVSLRMDGAPTDVPQPAHIHTGECPEPGAVKYPLNDVINGISETTLDIDLATLNSQLPLAINVHKSEDEVDVYVSCGDL